MSSRKHNCHPQIFSKVLFIAVLMICLGCRTVTAAAILISNEEANSIYINNLMMHTVFVNQGKGDGNISLNSEKNDESFELSIDLFTEDGIKYVKVTLKEMMDTGEMIPVEWEELMIEVERQFGLLPVAEYLFTDENGEVLVEFPDDLPGDKSGNVVIVVRLDEHPQFGNAEIRESVAWGIPLVQTSELDEKRTWMSKDPPKLFSVIFWGGLLAVWGIIGYIIFNLVKISHSNIES